jgi:hypothetical protein
MQYAFSETSVTTLFTSLNGVKSQKKKNCSHNNLIMQLFMIFFPLWRCGPTQVLVYSFMKFLDHTQRREPQR